MFGKAWGFQFPFSHIGNGEKNPSWSLLDIFFVKHLPVECGVTGAGAIEIYGMAKFHDSLIGVDAQITGIKERFL